MNSSLSTFSMVGLSVGSDCSKLWIRFRADSETREGMWYSFIFILTYVSFNDEVSNGGRPTRRV